MAVYSNNFAVYDSSLSDACSTHVTVGVYHTGKHWILYLKPMVKLVLALTVLNIGVLISPSSLLFAVSRLLVIAALLVTIFSLFVIWVEAQCNRYVISPKSIQIRHGLTKTSVSEFSYSNIESVTVFQTIAGRFFDYGTVKIKGNSGSCKTLNYVTNPNVFRQK